MTEHQQQEFKKIINDKQMKFQWGVAEPVTSHPNNSKAEKANIQQQNRNIPAEQPTPKARFNQNMINFQDLPVKESEIISTQKQNQLAKVKRAHNNSSINSGVYPDTKQHVQRLNNLKNEFQILKGIMIDSKIFDGGHKNSDLAHNLSKSNLGSLSNTRQMKIGEAVRGKDKLSRREKISSSSISDKDINIKSSHLKQRDNIIDPLSKLPNKQSYNYKTENIQKDIANSHVSNKRSQHHSQNPKTSRSKHSSRIGQNRQHSPKTGLLSSNLLEKHSLQLQLRNSLQKIQILLQNEIILKTRNNELEQKLREMASPSQKQQENKSHLGMQDSNSRQEYEKRIERYREQNRELVQRVAKLEGDAMANEARMDMLNRQKNKQINNSMEMKLAFANLQIENKRLKMQKQIDKRDLQYQIDRLKRQKERQKQLSEQKLIDIAGVRHEIDSANIQKDLLKSQYKMQRQSERQKIKRLEEQLEQRERKYKQSLSDLEKKNQLKQQTQLLQLIEVLHKKRTGSQGENQLTRQLNKLKNQIMKVKKQVDLTQSQFGFESKVISLEQALARDNQEKQKNLLEIQRFHKQFEDLKDKYKECQQQLEQQTQKYIKSINQLRQRLQDAQNYKSKYEHSEKQLDNLHRKNDDLQKILRKYEDMQNEIFHLRQALSKKETSHNLQIRDARRRVDQAQFESFKSQQQNQLNLDLNTRKLSSDIQILHGKLHALQTDRNYYRDQSNILRQQTETLSLQLQDQLLQKQSLLHLQTQSQSQKHQKIQRNHQNEISALKARFIHQQKALIDQLTILTNINQEQSQKLKRVAMLEMQNEELRVLCKSKVGVDASVLHLWEIKEVQYGNVNQLLSYVRSVGQDLDKQAGQAGQAENSKNLLASNVGQQKRLYYANPVFTPAANRVYVPQGHTVQYIATNNFPQQFAPPGTYPFAQPQLRPIPQPPPQAQLQPPTSIPARKNSDAYQNLTRLDRIVQSKQTHPGQTL